MTDRDAKRPERIAKLQRLVDESSRRVWDEKVAREQHPAFFKKAADRA